MNFDCLKIDDTVKRTETFIRKRYHKRVSFAPEFQCCYFCEPSCLFYLSFNFDFYVSKIMHL